MKKVAFVIQDLCGQGAQSSTAAMIRGFINSGYEVDLLISPVHQDKVDSGMYAFPVPEKTNWIWMPYRRARNNIFFLRRYLKKTDALAVISTSGPYHRCHSLAMIGLKTKALNVAMDHGNWFGTESKLRTKLIFGRFNRHFFVNNTSRENFLKVLPMFSRVNTHVVFNPVIDDLFFEKTIPSPTHPWLVNKKCFTFISAGAYCDSKKHLILIQAMERVVKKCDSRLILFGSGPLESQYREYITNHGLAEVVSVGAFSENLPAEMKCADGFLMASHHESFGIVIVEALASNLFVISTDAPYGPRDILNKSDFGKLVLVNDVDAMASAMIEMVNSPKKAVPEEAWSRFTESAVVKYFEEGLRI